MAFAKLCRRAAFGLIAAACGGAATAQTTITQWNFNDNSGGVPTMLVPSTGAGSAVLQGTVTANQVSGQSENQSSDPAVTNDLALNVTAFPPQGTGSGTSGIAFFTSTAGFDNITVGWDNRFSTTATRYLQFQYTLDATQSSPVWVNGPVFEQTTFNFWYRQDSATVADRRIVNLSSVAGASNNPRFGFRVVSIFSPVAFTSTRTNGGTYGANQAYNEVGGSAFAYGTGGTVRFDYVTISGTSNGLPVPASANVSLSSSAVCTGTTLTITADVFPGRNPDSTATSVTVNLTALGGGAAVPMTRPSPAAFPNRYSVDYLIPANANPAINLSIPVTVTDNLGRQGPAAGQVTVSDCSARGNVVISQMYGGGGNAGALIASDYVELYNRGTTPARITGWSIQYSGAGTGGIPNFNDSQRLILSGTIPAGGYYLVRLLGTSPPVEPTAVDIVPDAFLSTTASATAGVFALRTLPGALTTACTDPNLSDVAAYGTTTCAENALGGPALNNYVAAYRKGNGCVDTGDNSADFYAAPPSPRNSSSPINICPQQVVNATAAFDVSAQCAGAPVTLTATTTAPINAQVLADLTDFGQGPAVPMVRQSDGTYQVVVTLPVATPGFRQANVYVSQAGVVRGGASARVELQGCNNFVSGVSEPRQLCRDRAGTVRLVAFATRATQPAPGTIAVTADLSAIGGGSAVAMFDDGTNGDLVAGDDVYTLTATVPTGLPLPGVSIPVRITDDTGRFFVNHIGVNTTDCSDAAPGVKISGFHGGGGTATSFYRSDYVELKNTSSSPVNLDGWSVQYAFDSDPFNRVVNLSGTIQPNGFYLVEIYRAASGADLPNAADVVFSTVPETGINANAGVGKIALATTQSVLGLDFSNPAIVDLVGYGTSNAINFRYEGNGPASTPSVALALQRQLNGCQDTDNNAADFRTVSADFAPRNSSFIEGCSEAPTVAPFCSADYNRDGFLNLDDLGDYITDFYSPSPIPGGLQPNAITYPDSSVGYGYPCPLAPDARPPFPIDAHRRTGYRTGFSVDGANSCPLDPGQPFPNLDNLNDYITFYYGSFGVSPCN